MERLGELESSGEEWRVDVHAHRLACFPTAVGLYLVEGPAGAGEEGGTTVLDGVPIVGEHIGSVALGFQPAVEGRLVYWEDQIVWCVGHIVVEE